MRNLFLILGLFALAPSVARADDACAGDRKTLCADAKGPAMRKCMKEHEAQLSDGCKAQRANLGAARDELHKDCQADADKLCAGAKGKARMKCMKDHAAELSQPCKDAIAKAVELREEAHPNCKADIAKLCPSVKPGAGLIKACLHEHDAELSAPCKEALAKHDAKKAPPAPAPAK